MIISNSNRFLFIKPRKTAGTSLEIALSAALRDGDFATLIEPEEEPQRVVNQGVTIGSIPYGTGFRKRRLRDHSPLSQAVDCFGSGILDYKIATMTRNPWDRAVSQFFWSNRRSNLRDLGFDEQQGLFNAYTRKWGPRTWLDRVYGRKRQRALNASDLYHHNNEPYAQFAVRFEHIAADLEALCAWLGIEDVQLPAQKLKSGIRGSKQRPWQDFFDADVRDLVAQECAFEIDRFGYCFDASAPTRGPFLER